MKVILIDYTKDAIEKLILTKNTRHLNCEYGELMRKIRNMSYGEKISELKYVLNSVGSALEFVDYTFLIQGVTRAFTHQLVRHRVGTSFAQQSLRITDKEDFEYYLPDNIKNDEQKKIAYEKIMESISKSYEELLNLRVDLQDARGILPINVKTNILFKANLRSISDIVSERLCIRTQQEFRKVVQKIKEKILDIHPPLEVLFRVSCAKNLTCKWRNFKDCNLKNEYIDVLDHDSCSEKVAETIDNYLNENLLDYSPQPEIKNKKE